MRCKYPVAVRGGNLIAVRRILIAVAGVLAITVVLAVTGCGGSSSNGTSDANPSPTPPASVGPTAASEQTAVSGPTATAAGVTPGAVPDDISAEALRQILAFAAAKVNDATWETYLAGSEELRYPPLKDTERQRVV